MCFLFLCLNFASCELLYLYSRCWSNQPQNQSGTNVKNSCLFCNSSTVYLHLYGASRELRSKEELGKKRESSVQSVSRAITATLLNSLLSLVNRTERKSSIFFSSSTISIDKEGMSDEWFSQGFFKLCWLFCATLQPNVSNKTKMVLYSKQFVPLLIL